VLDYGERIFGCNNINTPINPVTTDHLIELSEKAKKENETAKEKCDLLMFAQLTVVKKHEIKL